MQQERINFLTTMTKILLGGGIVPLNFENNISFLSFDTLPRYTASNDRKLMVFSKFNGTIPRNVKSSEPLPSTLDQSTNW